MQNIPLINYKELRKITPEKTLQNTRISPRHQRKNQDTHISHISSIKISV